MAEACRWVTWHFLRFPGIRTPDMLDLLYRPIGAAGWEIGPDAPPKLCHPRFPVLAFQPGPLRATRTFAPLLFQRHQRPVQGVAY
jgi:hypothetical protein